MSAGYASRLKDYPNKGVCGLPEKKDTTRSYQVKRKRLLELVRQASGKIVILTGAGISTAAGIPDFRGPQGIWTLEKKQQKQQQQKTVRSTTTTSNSSNNKSSRRKRKREETVTPAAASSSSCATTATMDFGQAQPTLTHCAIRHLIDQSIVSFCVTQNVDGLHVRSGISRDSLAVLHGCVFTEKCEACGTEHFRNDDVGGMSFQRTGRMCTQCQSPLRDTLLDWKDPLPEDDYQRAVESCQNAKLVLCLGTSLRIEPAGSLPTLGQKFVIVNLQETPYDSQACLILRAKVDTVMQDLMQDLGFSQEQEWNVPAAHVEQLWKNPRVDKEYASTWWQIESEDEQELSNTEDSPPTKVSSSSEEDEEDDDPEETVNGTRCMAKKTILQKPDQAKTKRKSQKLNVDDPVTLVHRRVAKQFPDGVWYMGTIVNYNPQTEFWWIQYDDGDGEDMEQEEVERAIVAHQEQQQQVKMHQQQQQQQVKMHQQQQQQQQQSTTNIV